MDVELFERYFKSQQKKFKFDVIKVPGRVYPVKIIYKNYNSLS
jgi:HrpA-like RNA helicase